MTNVTSRPSVVVASVQTTRPLRVVVALQPPTLARFLFGEDLRSLRIEGVDVADVIVDDWRSDEARSILASADVIVSGWGAPRLDDADLRAAPRLRYLLHAGGEGAGLLPANAAGVAISNAGAVNAIPVAEYTAAMIVLANKQAFRASRLYRERRARIDRELEFHDAGNLRRVVGVVGASRIGRLVIERIAALDLDLLIYDPYLQPHEADALGGRAVDLETLMRLSHVVTLHPPLTSETTGMIGRRELGLLSEGATLINTSRGAVIDQDALIEALRGGRFDAVLDVTDPDVLPADSELYDLPNVVLTPHIAGSMGHEIRRMGDHVAAELRRVVDGRPLATPEGRR